MENKIGNKIYKLIEKNKVLLLQDKIFPNVISEITGEAVKGSWWGHPMGSAIYNALGWLEHNKNILTIKLVDGKVTYIHESLFADTYAIVCVPRDWQTKKLTKEQLQLLKAVSKKSVYEQDAKKDLLVLEKKLLVFSEEEHTDSGKHIKKYLPWKKSKICTKINPDYDQALKNIEGLFSKLNQKSGANAKLPW